MFENIYKEKASLIIYFTGKYNGINTSDLC